MPVFKRTKKPKDVRNTSMPVATFKSAPIQLSLTIYNEIDYQHSAEAALQQCLAAQAEDKTTWINVTGLQNVELITQLNQNFNIHPLVIEDIFNTNHRAKVEDYDNYLFILLKSVCWDESTQNFTSSQVSIILAPGLLLSFQEKPTPLVSKIQERLSYAQGRLRTSKSDYLAYALIDVIVDHYFVVLEQFSEIIETLENEIITCPKPQSAHALYQLKQQMYSFRKAVWPLREMVNHLMRSDDKFFTRTTTIYLRDIYDHIIQTIETIEAFHDRLDSMLDVHLSTLTNRMNEVMKVLTIIATIFIPLTFIASIYGMNFSYMPELQWRWGYPFTLGIMALIALLMMLYFKRKHWW